jgi:osmoprotectant transport system permease protein
LTDLYSTDAQVEHYDLRALDDDLGHFPGYDAVLLYRSDLEQSAPDVVSALRRLENRITAEQMIALNARVALRSEDPADVAKTVVDRVLHR